MKRYALSLFIASIFTFTVLATESDAKDPFVDFVNGIYQSVNDIAGKNKPDMEVNEKVDYMDDVYLVHSKAWKLPQTRFIVSQEEGSDAYLTYYNTTDQTITLPGGIKIGSSAKDLENFFGIPQSETFSEEHYELMDSGINLFFELDEGKQTVTTIQLTTEALTPDKILHFMFRENEEALNESNESGARQDPIIAWEDFIEKNKTFYTHHMSPKEQEIAGHIYIEYVKRQYFIGYEQLDGYENIGDALQKYFSKPKWEFHTYSPNYQYLGLYATKFSGIARHENLNAQYEIWFRSVPEFDTRSVIMDYAAINGREVSTRDILALVYLN